MNGRRALSLLPIVSAVGDDGRGSARTAKPPLRAAPEPSSNTHKAAKSMLWSAVENGGFALVSFSALIVYSRFLSAADFGLFSIALAVIELFGLLVGMLFHDALVQKRNVTQLHYDTAFTFTLVLSFVLLGGFVLFAPTLARLLGNPAAAPVISWLSLCFPATALAATLVAEQRRELAFRTLAVRTLVGRLSGAIVGIVLVLCGSGLWGLVAQQVLIPLSGSLVLWFTASSRPRLRLGVRELRELLAFGVYAVTGMFLSFAVKRVFVVVAGIMLGAERAGYLNLGFRAVDVLWGISAAAINQVALPLFARLQAEPARLLGACRRATEFACLALYPCFIGMTVVAPEVVDVLFGRKWHASSPYVAVLAALVIVRAAGLLFGPVLTALGRPRDSMLGTVVELSVMLALLAVFGASSLPVATAIWVTRELVAAGMAFLLVKRALPFSVREVLGAAVIPLAATACMAAVVLATRYVLPADLSPLVRLCVLVPTGVVAFLLGARLLGGELVARARQFAAGALARAQPS
jgi:PST family polysaccharide transporter